MKGKGFILERCERAVDEYFNASSDIERSNAIAVIDVLTSIFQPKELPLRLVLKIQDVCQDAMLRHYGNLIIYFR